MHKRFLHVIAAILRSVICCEEAKPSQHTHAATSCKPYILSARKELKQGSAQAANISRAQHRPIVTFMMAKQYRPQFLISSIFMLYQQFDGAPQRSYAGHFATWQALAHSAGAACTVFPSVAWGVCSRLSPVTCAVQASTLSSSSHPSSSGAHHHAVLLCKMLDEQGISLRKQHAVPAWHCSAHPVLQRPLTPSLRAQLSGRWQRGAAQHRHRQPWCAAGETCFKQAHSACCPAPHVHNVCPSCRQGSFGWTALTRATPLLTSPLLTADVPGRPLSTKCACAVNVCATFVVIYAVDRWGRRVVLIGGATHMFITQVQPLQHVAE